jgi:N-acyl-D-amino-acid deacylase
MVMGFGMRKPTAQELKGMEDLLDKLLSQGAFGMSLGLIYPPSAYGELEELTALAKVVKRHNGIMAVHMRSESTKIFEAVDEMLTVAKRSGVHLQISHLKLIGRPQWGKANELLKKIKDAKTAGVDVTCDQYPYLATCASLAVLIPDRMKDGGTEAMCERLKHPDASVIAETKAEMERRGGAEGVLIITTTGWKPEYDGKTLAEVAKDMNMPPEVAASEILVQSKGLAPCCYFCLNEDDMLTIMKEKFIAVGCDGYALPYDREFFMGANPHPRSYGTFPRFFQTVRDKKILSLEEAVYKATGLAAQILHLPDRGELAVGKRADITVWDWEKIKDLTEYTNPFRKPEGIKLVVLNGNIALKDKELVGNPQGKLIRHK